MTRDYTSKIKQLCSAADHLLKGGDISALCKKYYFSDFTIEDKRVANHEEDEEVDNDGEAIVTKEVRDHYLKMFRDHIDQLNPLNYDDDEDSLLFLMRVLEDLEHVQGYIFLVDYLKSGQKIGIVESDVNRILASAVRIDFVRKKIERAIEETFGKRLTYFLEIIGNIDKASDLKEAIGRINKHQCPIHRELCTKDIIPVNQCFVGHVFSQEMKNGFRSVINDVVAETYNGKVVPYYADSERDPDLFCKICGKIRATRFGIYDITGSNPNVALEVGLSLALGKETYVLTHKTSETYTDLIWSDRITYEDFVELRTELRQKIKKQL